MAIGAIFNSLVYGGVDSADYGVYITGDAVFNAPKRSVELVSVPGRNGAIEIDQGHFENIEVSYPAGMFGDDQTDFRERLSDFRNAIMSQKGYQRLSDTYHPDEYRMGIYVDGLEVEPKHYNEAGQFTLKFNCKPQRWLTSGEDPLDVMDFRGETYEDNAPYLLRRSPQYGHDYDREVYTLIGGSIAWNQLVQNGNFADTSNWSGNTTRSNLTVSNNVATITTVPTLTQSSYWSQNVSMVIGHKYMLLGQGRSVDISTGAQLIYLYYGEGSNVFVSYVSDTDWHNISCIVSCVSNTYNQIRLYAPPAGNSTQYKNIKIVDLTATFGTEIADYVYGLEQSTAGSGIAWLKSYGFLIKDYYAYNNGSLVSVKTSEHRTVGKNLLDENYFSDTSYFDINADHSVDCLQSDNRAWSAVPATQKFLAGTYVFSRGTTIGRSTIRTSINDYATDFTTIFDDSSSVTFTLPQDCYLKIKASYSGSYPVTVYPMIRFASVSDATFEPYVQHSYPLGNDDLRGIFKLSNGNLYADGDVKTSDGQIQRKFSAPLDLGTLNWTYNSADLVMYSDVVSSAVQSGYSECVCSHYIQQKVSGDSMGDKTCKCYNRRIYIKDLAYTDASTFKQHLTDISAKLVYELETPTTEQADPFASPQIVSPNGTEEYVDERSVPVPVGHRTVYGMDPSVIVNPTLFDAGPLLEVEGYGVVDINQHEITLENKRLGEIQLTNKTTADGSSLTVTFDASALNEGDEIYIKDFNRNKVTRYAEFNSSFNTIGVSLESESIEAWYDVSYNTVDGSAVDFWAIPDFRGISFEYGTANSSTKQTDYIIDWGDGSPSYTYALVAELSYDGANSVTLSIPTPNTASIPDTCTIAALFADSSLLILGDKTYIDCEIGEAYMIQDGSIISLNSAVDLGSELPTLKPGINRIIFDDTFTELIITPRWWKI